MLLSASSLIAQITSASVSGKVKDAKGEGVPGATVFATYTPTGAKYGVVSSPDGRFTIANMNPGGPYSIVASFIGYKTIQQNDIFLSLGSSNQNIEIVLQEESQTLQEVKVLGTKGGERIGTGVNIGESTIRMMPTLGRSLQDMTKLTPQFNPASNSFAGTNFRYNNVTIDGTVNNDAVGFSPSQGGQTGASGMPGSSTRTNAISLDAIKDIQVYIAPYDVKIGNFTGGSVNAVTRSGTNEVQGSAYFFGRNASITGPNVEDKSKISSDYHDYQTGFRVGLPLIKNKLFFFTNEEITSRQEPVFYGAGQKDATGKLTSLLDEATAQRIVDTLARRIGFNPGTYGAYNIYSKSTKFFNRIDWNISNNHQLSIRNNTIMSEATNLERDAANFRFASMDFLQNNTQSSTVAELKSRFGGRFSNSLILGYANIHDYRTPLSSNASIPQTEISYNGGTILFGNDREATVFNMRQKTFELTDNLTWFKGKHTFTVGTHNEFYNIQYGFVNSWNGRIAYRSLDEFYAAKVNRVRGSYSFGNNDRQNLFENPYANFNVAMLSAYMQDDIQVTDKLKISPGLRFDMANVPNGPSLSTKTQNSPTDRNYGTTYDYTPLSQIDNKIFGQILVSPRIGFSYDLKGDRSLIIRGGTGLFTGKIPFAWLGYAYYNDGNGYGSFDVNNLATSTRKLVGDPLKDGAKNYAFNNGQGNQTQIDLMGNNFKMPQVWRSNLAVDYAVAGYKLTLEGMFTQVMNDLKFQAVNLKDSVRYYSYDSQRQMPIYVGGGATGQRTNTALSNAYMLSNTNQGYRYSLTAQLSKTYSMGLNFSASYTYGKSFDISNGIRNSMESNWQLNQSLTPNDPKLAYSNFDIRHRLFTTIGYRKQWNTNNITTISLIVNAQSGNPFTYGFVNATIAGTPQAAGLAYIPKDVAEMTKYLTDFKDASGATITAAQQAQQMDAYISGNSYLDSRRGQFTERNTGRTPWNTTADVRLMHEFFIKSGTKMHSLQLTVDVVNFTNLLNSAWGRIYFVPNTFNSTVSVGLTRVSTVDKSGDYFPTYRFATPSTPYSVDQLASRFQSQVGLRYSF